MMKILVAVSFAVTASGQEVNRASHSLLPVEDGQFENCAAIEGIARSFDPGGADGAYSVELYPRTKGSNVFLFKSDIGIQPLAQLDSGDKGARFAICNALLS
jgi:hypothetical protein